VRLQPARVDDSDAMYDITTSVHLGEVYKSLIPSDQYERFCARYLPSEDRRTAYRHKIAARLADPDWIIWVAECDGEVCGFLMVRQTRDALKLHGLFISEKHQGQGVGRQLFDTWRHYARPGLPATLTVLKGNTRAIRLYESEGFTPVKLPEKRFYGAELIHMAKARP
jgi:ribosomal protein S18 acetylase RimI-like enzyme